MRILGVNDSTLLALYYPSSPNGKNLLRTVSSDGRALVDFMDVDRHFGIDPVLRAITSVQADGEGHCIFAASSAQDSLWVFDTSGRMIASGVVAPDNRWPSLATLLDPDRPGFPRGGRFITTVVALPACRAAVQVGTYFAGEGDLDRFGGGDVYVLGVQGDRLTHGKPLAIDGGLIGRDLEGRALILSPPVTEDGGYRLSRVEAALTTRPRVPTGG